MNLHCRAALGVAAVLFFAFPALTSAQDSSHKIAAMDEFQLQIASDPQISPDGKKIVYVRRFADPMTDKRYANLWIINADGSDHRPLTTGNRSDSSPRWSPDGTRITYLSDADGKQQIYVRWMDSGQTARITNLEDGPDAIAWSPDGKMLSFSSLVLGKGPHIADLPAAPSGAKWAEPATAYDRLVYRFNGTGYLKPGFMQVFVVSAEGGALRALTNRKGPDNAPSVSPSGKFISYTGFDDRYQGHQTTKLYLMNRDGTGSRSLSDKL